MIKFKPHSVHSSLKKHYFEYTRFFGLNRKFSVLKEKLKFDILQEMDVRIARMTPTSSALTNHNQNNQPYQYNPPYPCQTQQQEWIQPQQQQWETRQHLVPKF